MHSSFTVVLLAALTANVAGAAARGPLTPRGRVLLDGARGQVARPCKTSPFERFATAFHAKWSTVDIEHVARDMVLAAALQAVGEMGAQMILGYDIHHLDVRRIIIRASAVSIWYSGYGRYLHAIDAVKELAPGLMGANAGKSGRVLSASVRTAVDNFVSTPFFYFPFMHVFTGTLLEGETLAQCLKDYSSSALTENESSCLLYLPAQIANFGLVPPKYRAPVLFAVDLCWAVAFALLTTPHPAAVDPATVEAAVSAVSDSTDSVAVAVSVAAASAGAATGG